MHQMMQFQGYIKTQYQVLEQAYINGILKPRRTNLTKESLHLTNHHQQIKLNYIDSTKINQQIHRILVTKLIHKRMDFDSLSEGVLDKQTSSLQDNDQVEMNVE